MSHATKTMPAWALALLCVLPLMGFWSYGLFDLDEGFYGAVVADMMSRGDWVTPTLNGVPWFEKPILAYWLAIPSVALFGETWGPRLPSVLCTLATVWTIVRFASRHAGVETARVLALVLSTQLLAVALGRMMMTDAPLVLCLTVALTTLADWRFLGKPSHGFREWSLIGVMVGLGVLAKGPVALILFGGVFIVSSFVVPSFKGAWRSAWPIGLVLCVLVTMTWYVPCYAANGQAFVQKFLIEQNIGRFAGGDRAHTVPAWSHPVYYVVILTVSSLPWLAPALGKKELFKAGTDLDRYAWVWFLVPLGFFTVSGTKLPHYILPSIAPLCLLVSRSLLRKSESVRWEKWGMVWSPVVFVLAQGAFTYDWTQRMRDVQELARSAASARAKLYVFRIGREGPPSTGSLKLDDTSHPSIHYYYQRGSGRRAFETDDAAVLAGDAEPRMVLTRSGRLPPSLAQAIAQQGEAATVRPRRRGDYELWFFAGKAKRVERTSR